MIILEAIIDYPQDSCGEDKIAVSESCCAVIDGATPVKKFAFKGYNSNAEWMADKFSKYIVKNHTLGMDFIDLCKNFIDDTKNEYYLEKEDKDNKLTMPSLTTAAVTLNGDKVGVRVMCDSTAYILFKKGYIGVYTDRRVDEFSKRTLKAKAIAKEKGIDAAPLLLEQRRKNKERMNADYGYWVVTYIGKFEHEFLSDDFDMEDISRILICTDGFDRIFNAIPDPIPLMKILRGSISLDEAVKYLRMSEDKFKDDDLWQAKLHDDVAAILISFDN